MKNDEKAIKAKPVEITAKTPLKGTVGKVRCRCGEARRNDTERQQEMSKISKAMKALDPVVSELNRADDLCETDDRHYTREESLKILKDRANARRRKLHA